MKVVRVINSLGFGGVEKVFEIVAKYYAGDKADVLFLVLGKGGAVEKSIREMGYTVTVLDANTRIPGVRLIVRLWVLFIKWKPEVVHTAGAEANFHGIIAAFLAGVPVRVAEEVGMPAHSARAKFFFRVVYKLASRVIAVAHLVERYLLDTGEVSASRLAVIYNPVDVHSFLGVQKDWNGDLFRVVAVCRLDPIKNLDLLITAFSEVRKTEKHRRMELWIIGEGPERKRLEDLAGKLGLGDGVVFWGYQDQPAPFYKGVSLFVLPSFSEGLPVSLAEAMLTGTPCAVTKIGGATELIEDGTNGWLIDPYDQEAFTGLLGRIMEMPEEDRKRIAVKGRETIAGKCMPEQYINSVWQLYNHLFIR